MKCMIDPPDTTPIGFVTRISTKPGRSKSRWLAAEGKVRDPLTKMLRNGPNWLFETMRRGADFFP